jgi:hypothetical protein
MVSGSIRGGECAGFDLQCSEHEKEAKRGKRMNTYR